MKDLLAFGRLLQWPTIYVATITLTQDRLVSSVVILALIFRRDLSQILRNRRFEVKFNEFHGRIDSGEPVKPARASKTRCRSTGSSDGPRSEGPNAS